MWTWIGVVAVAFGSRLAVQDGNEVLREHDADGRLRVEREVVRGAEGGLVPHGAYREFHPDGTPAVEGYYLDGERHRKWEAWHPGGRRKFTGVYNHGFRKGRWIHWDEQGRIEGLWTGEYELARTKYADGTTRSQGEMRDGLRHGRWVFYWPRGAVKAEGTHVGGWIEGEWIFRHQDGSADPDWITGVYEGGRRGGDLPEDSRIEPPDVRLDRLPVPGTDPNLYGTGNTIASLLRLDPLPDLASGRAGEVFSMLRFGLLCDLPAADEPDAAQRLRLLIARNHSLYALLEDSPELRWIDWPWAVQQLISAVMKGRVSTVPTRFDVHPRLSDGSPFPFEGRPRFPYGDRPHPGSAKRKGKLEPEIAAAVELALRWLAGHQDEDGKWDCDEFLKHDPTNDLSTGRGHQENDIGVTGLALLAFLGNGSNLRYGPYRETVARGVAWLVSQQDYESGLLGERCLSMLYQHAIGTIALCEALATSDNAVVRGAVERALGLIGRARNPYGAWRYDFPPKGDNDTSVTTWMICALEAARWSGCEVDEEARRGALDWLDETTDRASGRAGYMKPGLGSSRYIGINDRFPADRDQTLTAGTLFARILLGQRTDAVPVLRKQAALLLRSLPAGDADRLTNEVGYWHFGSSAMHQVGGKSWEAWRGALLPVILDSQRKDGASRGSWDPDGPWGWSGGRVYSTAMAALALEAGWRLEPLSARK